MCCIRIPRGEDPCHTLNQSTHSSTSYAGRASTTEDEKPAKGTFSLVDAAGGEVWVR